jgi:hypothetical protein
MSTFANGKPRAAAVISCAGMLLKRRVGFIALCSCLGCSDVLGLNDLRYDRDAGAREIPSERLPDAETPKPDVDAHTIEVDVDADANTTPDASVRYPVILKPSQIPVTSNDARRDNYLVYDRSTGTLDDVTAANGGFKVSNTYQWTAGYSLVIEIAITSTLRKLIGYNAVSGIVEYATLPGVSGPIQGDITSGSAGFSHLIPLSVNGEWRVLAYSSTSGHYRLTTVDRSVDAGVPIAGEWQPGFSAFAAYALPGYLSSTLLMYRADTGAAELQRVEATGLQSLYSGNLGAAWTSVVSFSTASGPKVLLYEALKGDVTTGVLTFNPVLSFEQDARTFWREQISGILPLLLQEQPCAITYSSATNVANLVTLVPLEPSVVR